MLKDARAESLGVHTPVNPTCTECGSEVRVTDYVLLAPLAGVCERNHHWEDERSDARCLHCGFVTTDHALGKGCK